MCISPYSMFCGLKKNFTNILVLLLTGSKRSLIGVTPLNPRQVSATSPFSQRTL